MQKRVSTKFVAVYVYFESRIISPRLRGFIPKLLSAQTSKLNFKQNLRDVRKTSQTGELYFELSVFPQFRFYYLVYQILK